MIVATIEKGEGYGDARKTWQQLQEMRRLQSELKRMGTNAVFPFFAPSLLPTCWSIHKNNSNVTQSGKWVDLKAFCVHCWGFWTFWNIQTQAIEDTSEFYFWSLGPDQISNSKENWHLKMHGALFTSRQRNIEQTSFDHIYWNFSHVYDFEHLTLSIICTAIIFSNLPWVSSYLCNHWQVLNRLKRWKPKVKSDEKVFV